MTKGPPECTSWKNVKKITWFSRNNKEANLLGNYQAILGTIWNGKKIWTYEFPTEMIVQTIGALLLFYAFVLLFVLPPPKHSPQEEQCGLNFLLGPYILSRQHEPHYSSNTTC